MRNGAAVAALVTASLLTAGCADDALSRSQAGATVDAVTRPTGDTRTSPDDTRRTSADGRQIGLVSGALANTLDERDQQRLAESTRQTIATGAAQMWRNAWTGVSVKTEVMQSMEVPKRAQIPVLADRIRQVPPLEFIGEDYTATKTANIRSGPGTEFTIVGKLAAGESTRVVGKVVDRSWYMVAEDGVASGFIAADLLQANEMAAVTEQTPTSQTEVARATRAAGTISQTTVAGSSECRVVQRQIMLKDGKTEASNVKACRGPNGWEITQA